MYSLTDPINTESSKEDSRSLMAHQQEASTFGSSFHFTVN